MLVTASASEERHRESVTKRINKKELGFLESFYTKRRRLRFFMLSALFWDITQGIVVILIFF